MTDRSDPTPCRHCGCHQDAPAHDARWSFLDSHTFEPRRQADTIALFERAKAEIVPGLLHSIAVSIASFVAAIDTSSAVAEYIERRLQPLASMANVDIRCRRALETIAGDGRAAPHAPPEPEKHHNGCLCPDCHPDGKALEPEKDSFAAIEAEYQAHASLRGSARSAEYPRAEKTVKQELPLARKRAEAAEEIIEKIREKLAELRGTR